MRKPFLRILLLLAGFAGLIIPARAQADDQIAVKIPFQFVAAGQSFPAGEYRISRLGENEPGILILTSVENRAKTIMLRVVSEDASHGKAQLNFAIVGNQHFLSRVESEDRAYILSVPSADALLAAAPNKGNAASSSSGSN